MHGSTHCTMHWSMQGTVDTIESAEWRGINALYEVKPKTDTVYTSYNTLCRLYAGCV